MTITSHAAEIFRQGVWASLTGGWCYDPRQSLACNVVHMYLWMFLFALPLLIVLCYNLTWLVIGVYALVVGILFAVLKITNYYLHTIFDTHEPIDVIVASSGDDGDADVNGGVDLEGGLHAVEEDHSDISSRSRKIQSELGSAARASTLYEVLGESSLAASSREITEFPDDETEYAMCDPASSETAVTALGESGRHDADPSARFRVHHQRIRAVRYNKSNRKERNTVATTPRTSDNKQTELAPSSPTDYLAVEADVHSMPNELTGKEDMVDVENIELRTVRSDSKLIPSKQASFLRDCSSLMTADVTSECVDEQGLGGKGIHFLAGGGETGKTGDTDEGQEKLPEEDTVYEDDMVDETGASSSTFGGYNRKYSEPVFVVGSVLKGSTGQENCGRDTFDRFVRRPTSARKAVTTAPTVDHNVVRRTRSTVETCAQRRNDGRDKADSMGAGMTCTSSTLLSETCLEKCRGKGVRKSYPGKTSSTDIFLLQHVGAQKEPTIAEGLRRNVRESDSIESSGTGLEGSCIVGVEENSGGSQPISRADDETGQTTLTVGRVTRFLSVDVPLTDIPERDSESERPEGVCDIEAQAPDSFRVGSVMECCAPAFTTDQYGTCQSDVDYGMGSSFYATASEGSAAPSESNDHSNKRRRRWASVDDPPIQSPKTKLIKNLRDTLETLKSETPTTGSSTTTALYETDRFVADLQALKDASTPDLRWLFDDAAAVLGTSPHSHAASSAGSSPTSRPRLASLHGRELVRSASSSKRDPEASQSPSLPATLSNICSPALPADVTLIQHQFRERLMEEIKRLLEEIIDSHPEALEAIESVRQAKLARIAERRTVSSEGGDQCGNIKVPKDDQFMDEEDDGRSAGPSHRARGQCQGSIVEEPKLSSRKSVVAGEEETVVEEDGSQKHDSSADSAYNKCMRRSNETSMVAVNSSSDAQYLRRNLALAELARRRNVHVARSHDDTSEGAVHYFQDTDGKWYTYAFNAEGVATAQLLGSDRALMELIAQQQEEAELRQSSQRKRRGRGKLTPSSRDGNTISGSATSARRPDPFQARGSRSGYSGSQRQGRVAPPAAARTVLARTGSSSSEESFLALDAPASIMHVGGVAGTCRTGAAALNISRAAGSLLPVEYAGGRVALPIRLHQHSSGSGQSSGLTAASAGANRRRSGATNSFVPLRHMLNRSGGTSTQFLSAAAPASVITRCRSGSLTSGRDAAGSFITAAASQQNADEQTTPGEYSTIGLSSSNFLAFSGSLRTPSDLSHSSLRARFFATLAGGVEGLPSMIGAAHAIGGTNPHGKLASNGSTAKRKQYYRVSLCPGFNARCCPTWLTSRLRAWKFWTQNGSGADTAAKSSGLTCCPKRTFKLSLDRLRLMAIFDRNRTKFSAFVDILLAVMVALVACGLLTRPLFYDLELVMACVVTAGAQFSLMKSVQPDASSPVHGYNALVAYSRPMYYCIFGTALYIFDRYLAYHPSNPYATETLYSSWPNKWQCWWSTLKNFFATLFLFLPVVFTFGLLPQLDTFIIYILEQLEMLVFGGTACVGLASGFFSVSRSAICAALLFALNYFAVQFHPLRPTQNVAFSAFCGAAVFVSYLLSRSSSDPRLLGAFFSIWRSRSSAAAMEKTPSREELQSGSNRKEDNPSLFYSDATINTEHSQQSNRRQRELSFSARDPLPSQLFDTMALRLEHDLLVGSLFGIIYFALHCSTVFVVFKTSPFRYVLPLVVVTVGFVCHYVLPQMRLHTPWRILASPLLKTNEHRMFDVDNMAKLMPFERLYAVLALLERNLLYPLVVLYLLTASGEDLLKTYGVPVGSVMMAVASTKLLRTGFCNAAQLYLPLGAAALIGFVDFPSLSLTMLLDFYLMALIFPKFMELVLKLQFIFSYVAPWQISWGSAFHAFAQPTAIPHSAFTLAVATISSILSAPLNPFLGSAVFLMSYIRPVKFWEKNYNTKRIDNSNTRLISQIDRGPMTDDSNLNAIFYEHLTRSLQRSLAGDLRLGRMATSVSPGDCFILASFYLNCLVHVIEVGNGFLTFQLRGLEFRGTYCQQREVEAINEEIGDQGCCCCGGDAGSGSYCCMRGFLSFNAAWNLSWLSWRVTAAKFILEGYSVSDNSALSLLQLIELRKLLVTLYVKCIIFYALKSSKLEEWLSTEAVVSALEPIANDPKYVDVDPSFCTANDDDYDCNLNGISRQSFCQQYLPWLEYCYARRKQDKQTADGNSEGLTCEKDIMLTALCYGLALVGRRLLGTAAQGRHTTGAESFVYGLHALFKGDFRITCARDEWVFADIDILKSVIAPAVRMALKLHQDHFTAPDDFESMLYLFGVIDLYDKSIFISHENDPAWRHAVLNNTRSLLALRHVFEDGQDDFKIIMLNRRHMSFRVIALNKECVRAFWAGQQQELIFLRNRNPERGSIQNARQVLRNMINSSADQPIGYPIYVSPLTTSFCETHEQIAQCVGPPLTTKVIGRWCRGFWHRLLGRCGTSGSSNFTSRPAAANLPSAGLVHFGVSNARAGNAEVAETSLIACPIGDQRQQQRNRPVPRPRTSLLNAAAVRRDVRWPSGGAQATATLSRAAGIGQHLPHPTPRHGSAPPVMQRSLTHPLRASSLTSHVLSQRQNEQRAGFVQLTPARSEDSVNSKRALSAPRNSVVSAGSSDGSKDSSGTPRVSLGSMLALNVQDCSGASTTTAASRERRGQRVRIVDASVVLENMDKMSSGSLCGGQFLWPREEWRQRGGRQSWKRWQPEKGMEGSVVHKWKSLSSSRHGIGVDRTILLVNILDGKYYVPIFEEGVEWTGDEL